MSNDTKFKILLYLDTIHKEIRINDLSTSMGVPQDIIHRALIELTDAGLCTTKREGRFLFVKTTDFHKSPFSLQNTIPVSEM
ncbi:MAG: winged helix-turn-helix domain-containing protein [Candidatus Kariarchaeaceae archaeon]|jgi:DeoR/GlpR family transcriptional regulator of sugar metabolism